MTQTLVFASGKGGVGKSTVTLNVALALAKAGVRVGLVDADVYGPDIPAMLGITRRQRASSITLWQANTPAVQPIEHSGIKVMSPQFMVSEEQALDWQGPLVELLLRRIIHDVEWGELDVLLVDVPPGTGDLQQQVFGMLPDAWATVIVTPQYAAHLDARKLVTMLRRRKVRLFGGVENMTGLGCPDCGHHVQLFEPVAEEYSIWAQGVQRLASVPFVPAGSGDAAEKEFVELARTIDRLLL